MAVLYDVEYGAAVTSAPRFAPSSVNCTPTTPTLSDADAATVIVFDTLAPSEGAVTDTVGGVGSLLGVVAVAVVLGWSYCPRWGQTL
jgi:hypothetical protein